ncbi:MAG: LysM peptidoglycan-binding domain-containing protein, partial [Anaerolineae bacterium]|nr:LysM peptidoglycan-binding domain-containing protein [Anaerolineae bacterium]
MGVFELTTSLRRVTFLIAILTLALVAAVGCSPGSSERNAPPPTAVALPSPSLSPTMVPTNTPVPSATPTRSTATPTPSATPTTPVSPTPGPTIAPDLALEFTTLKNGQYLGYVAQRYGVSLDELVQFSGIINPDVVPIGQGLIIPHHTDLATPDEVLLPDSELVYGQGYVDFDLAAFVEEQGGRLSQVSMTGLDGEQWSGADVV